MKYHKKYTSGEIATIITVGAFLVIGVASLVSSSLVKNKQTSSTKAAGTYGVSCTSCDGPGATCVYHPELDKRVNPSNPGCDDNGCSTDPAAGNLCPGDKQSKITAPPIPACTDYKSVSDCEAKCGAGNCSQVSYSGGFVPDCFQCANKGAFNGCSPGKMDTAGTCNPACCSNDNDCKMGGTNQACGVQNGYCKSGLSCAEIAPGQTKPLYVRICSPGNSICAWTYCTGKNIDPKTGNTIPLSDCTADQNSGSGLLCKSDDECTPPANGCFHLTDEIYYDASGKTFSHWVKFWSDGGDGHISLSLNGNNTGLRQTPFNRNVHVPSYNVPPEYTGGNLGPGTQTYTGEADNCKEGIGKATISCSTGINPDGTAFVRGAGCTAKNFTSTAPKAVPAPTSGSTTITPAVSTTASENRCPDNKNDAVCSFGTCGAGFVTVDRPCFNPYDVCCVKSDTTANKDLLTPLPATTEKRTFEFQLDAGAVPQFFQNWGLSNMQICDFIGSKILGQNDLRNCHAPASPPQLSGNKVKITYDAKPNQKQQLCDMSILGIPLKCFPIN